jgi:hypothetical protein
MKMTLDADLAAEAKALVVLAFRNGPIEDLDAGKPNERYRNTMARLNPSRGSEQYQVMNLSMAFL